MSQAFELGTVVPQDASREVVLGNPLSRRDLFERFDRLTLEVLGGLLCGHPLCRSHIGQVLRRPGEAFGHLGQNLGHT